MIKKYKGEIYLLLSAMIFGSGLVAQSEGNSLGPWTFSCVRFFLGAAALFPIAYLSYRRSSKATEEDSDPIEKQLTIRQMLPGAFAVGLDLALMVLSQQYGLMHTSVGKAGFISSLYIILVPLAGVLVFQKTIRFRVWIAAITSMVGFYLISVSGDVGGLNEGDLIMVFAAMTCVVDVFLVERYARRVDPFMFSFLQFMVTSIIFLPGALALENATPEMFKAALIPILYAGVGNCAAAYTLQIMGQKYVPSERASLLVGMESLFSLFAGMLILHEMLSGRELAGCAMIFFAVLLAESGHDSQ